jgi:hypothetical protein
MAVSMPTSVEGGAVRVLWLPCRGAVEAVEDTAADRAGEYWSPWALLSSASWNLASARALSRSASSAPGGGDVGRFGERPRRLPAAVGPLVERHLERRREPVADAVGELGVVLSHRVDVVGPDRQVVALVGAGFSLGAGCLDARTGGLAERDRHLAAPLGGLEAAPRREDRGQGEHEEGDDHLDGPAGALTRPRA